MPAKPLSPDQLAEAATLKKLFAEWQAKRSEDGLPSSQEAAIELLGFGQSALSQYINGRIPLNVEAAAAFARTIGVKIDRFSPIVAAEIRRAAALIDGGVTGDATGPSWISQDAYKLLGLYHSADREGRDEIMRTAEDYQKSRLPSVASNDD